MATSARPQQQDEAVRIVEAKLNSGVITQIDSRDIPTSAVQVAKNCFCRFDKLGRRDGTVLATSLKPNVFPVTKLSFFETGDGSPYSIRMTPSSVHTLTVSGWSSLAITPPLTGIITDRFNVADILDKFIFTNNGANPPQIADFGAGTVTPLGNWTSVYPNNPRFLIGFFNRALFFAIRDSGEATAAWSADGIPTQFDPTVDQTAGSSPIIESPADLSDFITGALAFTNVAIIFRQHSIWLATKQPIPTDPFYFFSTLPGIGCDCSYSIQLVGNGVVWCDANRKEVYAYTPGGVPEKLATPIKDQLFADITDTSQVFSAYNSEQSEYLLCIPIAGNFTRVYVYNFDNKTWVVNEYYGLTCADDFQIATSSITIDDLVGPIDSLVGTIDGLSKSGPIESVFAYGRNDGTIAIEDETTDTDAPHADFPSGVVYTTQIQSKEFQIPESNTAVTKINLSYVCSRPTTLVFEYSRDSGQTWKTGKTHTPTKFNKSVNLSFRKAVKCTSITWRLTYTTSDLTVLGYEVYGASAGDTRTGQ